MSRVVAVIVVAALVVAIVVVVVWRPFAQDDTIRTRALGVWQESTPESPVRLTVSTRGGVAEAAGEAEYWVTYPDASDTPFPARLDGQRIQVLDPERRDVLWSMVYDDGADALIVTQPGGGDSFILRRISE